MTTWYTMSKETDLQGIVADEQTGKTIAVTYDPKDAPLIAAAPALAELLREVGPGGLSRKDFDTWFPRIRAALAALEVQP